MKTAMISDVEALRIAVQIEKKGERFYKMAQAMSKSPEMTQLLELLRAQEQKHAERFESMYEDMLRRRQDEDDDTGYDQETGAFLSAIASEVVFPGGVMASMMNRRLETIPDLLMVAIGSEKDSILFYMELVQNTHSEENIPVFLEIIEEEKKHLLDLQQMLEATK